MSLEIELRKRQASRQLPNKDKVKAKAKDRAKARAKAKARARVKAKVRAKAKARAKVRAKAKDRAKDTAKARTRVRAKARARVRAKATPKENTNQEIWWEKVKNKKPNEELVFVHTPKCAGRYTAYILRSFKIKNKGHNRASKNEGITFTVVRDPVERFESLLNFRLGGGGGRKKRVAMLKGNDNAISLNEIVRKMSDAEITGFSPYRSLTYWSRNIDIFITIDKLHAFLAYFGYHYDLKSYPKKNVSKKERGTFDTLTKNRVARLYSEDIILFNTVVGTQRV